MLEKQIDFKNHAYHFELPESRAEGAMWLHWIVRLRYLAVMAQIATVSFTFQVLSRPGLVLPVLAAAVVGLIFANAYAEKQLRSGDEITTLTLLSHLQLDVAVLTLFFALCGGPDNPFVMLYVIHVVMGAIMLHAGGAVALTTLVLLAYVLLGPFHLPLHLDAHALGAETLMRIGQISAFSITVVSVGAFALGMANSMRARSRRLHEAGLPRTETEELEIKRPTQG